MSKSIVITLAVAGCLASPTLPTIYGAMEPVGPGDIVTLAGDGLANASLSVCSGVYKSCEGVEPLSPTAFAVKFVLPGPPSVSTVVVAASGGSANITLGLPHVDWFSVHDASSPNTAFPGSTLTFYGRNFAYDATGRCLPWTAQQGGPVSSATIVVATPTGQPPTSPAAIVLPPWPGDAVSRGIRSCFRLDSTLPASMSLGTWDVYIAANGLAGLNASTSASPALSGLVVAPPPTWPPGTWTLGASSGCADLASCLTTAGAAGGGTITVPAGTWSMPSGALLSFPSVAVAIAGAGRDVTTIEWPQGSSMGPTCAGGVVTSASPAARWSIADVSLVVRSACQPGAQPPNGMPIVAIPSGSAGVALRHVRIVNDLTVYPGIQLGNAISITNASFVSLVDVEVTHAGSCDAQWPSNTALHVSLNSTDVSLRGLVITTTCPGYSVTSSSRVEFVDSALVSVGDVSEGQGFNTLGAPAVLEHIYYGNTTTTGNPSAPERWESMTYDG
jgi:hypothetical protein